MGEDGEAGLTGLILPSLPSSARFQKNSSLVNGSSYLVGWPKPFIVSTEHNVVPWNFCNQSSSKIATKIHTTELIQFQWLRELTELSVFEVIMGPMRMLNNRKKGQQKKFC